jgi:hypothetical protein
MFFLRHRRTNKTLYFQSEIEIGSFFKSQDGSEFWSGGAVAVNCNQLTLSDFTNGLIESEVQRRKIKMKVILALKDKTFLTYTEGVSEQDLMVEDSIPEAFKNGNVQVYVSLPNSQEFLLLKGTTEEHARRVSLEGAEKQKINKIVNWPTG